MASRYVLIRCAPLACAVPTITLFQGLLALAATLAAFAVPLAATPTTPRPKNDSAAPPKPIAALPQCPLSASRTAPTPLATAPTGPGTKESPVNTASVAEKWEPDAGAGSGVCIAGAGGTEMGLTVGSTDGR